MKRKKNIRETEINKKTKNEQGEKNQKGKLGKQEKYGSNRRVQKDGSKMMG